MSRGLYSSIRWKRVRLQVFNRDGYKCTQCGRRGRLECDHIRRLKAGGDPFALSNLRTLCRSCHIAKTAKENRKPVHPEVQAWQNFIQKPA